ncbi:uncharacterized protein LOC123498119 isoform X2 [Portunus trituberculatus]|uniref:uncharacterized protein LOC123498119 isoform X2 n=1 Tax=Portunus trituberculatus TaxID=210409 RepID=UPI001E1CC6A0|nr:uncharacterized protein LOC123498119 isoform X2 [Portunus trituberculatus]
MTHTGLPQGSTDLRDTNNKVYAVRQWASCDHTVEVICGSHDCNSIVIVIEMESEERNCSHFSKCYFQVFLEDEEETSLFMDSWIYLDHEVDEELSFDKECQSSDQDPTDITKKLEDKNKLSLAESFPCNSSAEDKKHNFSVTVPHFHISDKSKNTNIHETSIEYTQEDSDSKITCTDASEVVSSEAPHQVLCSQADISEHTMVVCNVGENSVEKSDSSVVASPDTISESSLSMVVDGTIDFNKTHAQLSDVCSSDENIAKSTDTISKSLSSMVIDADTVSDETIIYSSDTCSDETNACSSDLCISEDRNTTETIASDADKSSDIISKSLQSVSGNDTIDCNETSTHQSLMYCSKVKSELPDIHASKSFQRETMNSGRDSSKIYKYSTNMCSGKVKNIKETYHTHVSNASSPETVQLIMKPFMKSESNCSSIRKVKPISSEIQKKNFPEDTELVIVGDDDEIPIIISDDETPTVVSNYKDLDISDIEIIYVEPHQLSASTDIKDKKYPLGKKMKYEHQERDYTSCVIPTNYGSASDLMISKEIKVSQLTSHRPQKVKGHPKTSEGYWSDVIPKRKKYFSDPEIIDLEPSKPKRKRKEHKSGISFTDLNHTKSVFIPNEKNLGRFGQKYAHKHNRSDLNLLTCKSEKNRKTFNYYNC